jgi:hypothetical protein
LKSLDIAHPIFMTVNAASLYHSKDSMQGQGFRIPGSGLQIFGPGFKNTLV